MQPKETTQEPKSLAKAVGASLKRQGHAVPHGVLLNALASAGNLRDWQKLLVYRQTKGANTEPEQAFSLASAMGESLDGVLHWEGWNVPASLNTRTGLLDVGDFHLEHPSMNATLKVTHPKWGAFTLQNVCYLPKECSGEAAGQWHVPKKTFDAFVEEVKVHAQRVNAQALRLQGPAVSAKFWTDDHVFEVTFQANAFLQQASDEALSNILNAGCSGDYSTDEVAQFLADEGLSPELSEAFDYLAARNKSSRDTVGFEVALEVEDFYRWLDAHRTVVLAKYLCEDEGITMSEAQEEEIRGRWDWYDDQGNASEASLETQDEAALDAYRSLGLLEEVLRVL